MTIAHFSKTVCIFAALLVVLVFANAFQVLAHTPQPDDAEKCDQHFLAKPPHRKHGWRDSLFNARKPHFLCRLGYAVSFNPDTKVPDWAAFHLTADSIDGPFERQDDFRADPDVPEGERSELSDYEGSGYDRGHMAYAAAMRWSELAMSESFLLTNMAPQVGVQFNRHIWKKLETCARSWAQQRGELYEFTGPIYSGQFPETIGESGVVVPSHFYKILFDPNAPEGVAFILPNKKIRTRDLPKYIRTIDDVESRTGFDFFRSLANTVEYQVEAALNRDA